MVELPPSERFIDNQALKGREEKFLRVFVKTEPVLVSWKQSLFAHDWLDEDGKIKSFDAMSEKMQIKRRAVETQLGGGTEPLERPVLGVGILDNIEIGSGRDLFLALAARGMKTVPVHIPKSHEKEFRTFIVPTP